MASVQEITKQVFEEIENDKSIRQDEIIHNEIHSIIRELKGEGVTGKSFRMYTADELSGIGGELSAYLGILGIIWAKAERNRYLCAEILKVKKDKFRTDASNMLKSEGAKVTESAIGDRVDSLLYRASNRVAALSEIEHRCKNLWFTVQANLRSIQYRLMVLMGEASKEGKFNNHLSFDLGAMGAEMDSVPEVPENIEGNNSGIAQDDRIGFQ